MKNVYRIQDNHNNTIRIETTEGDAQPILKTYPAKFMPDGVMMLEGAWTERAELIEQIAEETKSARLERLWQTEQEAIQNDCDGFDTIAAVMAVGTTSSLTTKQMAARAAYLARLKAGQTIYEKMIAIFDTGGSLPANFVKPAWYTD